MSTPAPTRAAFLSALGCYTLWGFMPLLFIAQGAIGFTAIEILGHRAVWSVLFAAGLVLLAGQWPRVREALANPRTLGWLALATVLIALNWGVYVWAATHQATLEASLGYYINPLLNMVVGLWLFRERIDRIGWAAIGLAAIGVLFQALALGRPPWISLFLAFSFGAYGIIKKRVPVEAQTGLFIECLMLVPFGVVYVVWLQMTGAGHGFDNVTNLFWAVLNGPWTVVPLALFAFAARRMPLSTLGFIQFLAPTLQFCVGVATGEALTPLRIVSFVFIWLGVGVFAVSSLLRARAARRAAEDAAMPA
ncbi:EamA family transporter RarD [Brevundimonas bacteroides]|uniref:EamA family transporter RarD n=1 Tax=Brevundimonas bacteroides TaxID=74311 RepID=UPI00055021DD|nr:EamA family transporter RarD [Brevundimonas bacteroides]